MQLKNWSVGTKIWSLVLMSIVILIGVAAVLGYQMHQVNQKVQAETLDYEQQTRKVLQWRGVIGLAVSNAVAGAMSAEEPVWSVLQANSAESLEEANALQQELEQLLQHPLSKQQLAVVTQNQSNVMQLIDKVLHARNNSAFMESQEMLKRDLLPAVDVYNDTLAEMVAVQERLRDQVIAAGNAEYRQTLLMGAFVAVAVVILGLPLERAVELADAIASGDLTVDVHDTRKDELGRLLRSLSAMTQQLRQVVGEVRNGIDSVSSAASQIASGNQDLSGRTEQTAANLQQTAASIEELTATVSQSADTARQANQLASNAVQAAERGGQVVEQVVSSMQQITSSSHKISDIIGVIDGIAFQTNILALNAAVEAARAGEQGRGFAVVAGEVRSLAQRSAEAAKEIKALISASVSNVNTGSAQVSQAGDSMQEIVSSVRRVTDLIGEISAAASEQRDGFTQVNHAVSNLDQMTQQNAALVEESSAAAVAMNEQAQRLAQAVSIFNVGQASAALVQPVMHAQPAARQPLHQAVAAPQKAPEPADRASEKLAITPPSAAVSGETSQRKKALAQAEFV
ncbi:MAG: methyl-accepting chemotaxis protein [Comamonadaceae bacterium]|nr:methyl-accepting chemotaxis protein [Comamonadaceae bacterium]